MAGDAASVRDKQVIVTRHFDAALRARLRALVSDELIEAHRANPPGPHGDALERLLNYFRRAAMADKYAILAVRPFAEYRVVALSGRRGVRPRIVDERNYPTENAAQHAVFLRRVRDLMEA